MSCDCQGMLLSREPVRSSAWDLLSKAQTVFFSAFFSPSSASTNLSSWQNTTCCLLSYRRPGVKGRNLKSLFPPLFVGTSPSHCSQSTIPSWETPEHLPLNILIKQVPALMSGVNVAAWNIYFYRKSQHPGTHLKGSHVFRAGISWALLWEQFKRGSSALTPKKLAVPFVHLPQTYFSSSHTWLGESYV